MAQRGLFGTIEDTMTSPLWLGGAALLTGEGMGGAMQGMQMGAGFQQHRKAQQQQRDWQDAFSGQGGQGTQGGPQELLQGLPPNVAPLVAAMGPDKGAQFLAQHAASRQPPWWVQQDGGVHPAMRQKTALGAMRTQINNQMAGETSYDKELGKQLAGEFVTSQQSLPKATRDLGSLQVLDQALADPNLYTGTGGETVQGLKRAASTLFGVDVKGVSSGEVVQSLSSEIAASNKDKLPGPLSDSDRQFLVDMAPNLSKTPEGNRAIIQLGMLSKRYEIDRAKAIRDYAGRNNGRLDAGVYAAVAELDGAYGVQFQQLMGQIRSMAPIERRGPTTGTPLYHEKYGLE